MGNTIKDVLEDVQESLAAICTDNKWELSTAADPFFVFDMLYQRIGKGVVIIGYGGKTVHQQVSRAVISKMRFNVTVSTRRDLNNQLGGIMNASGTGNKSLLEMLDIVETAVLGLDVSNGLSEKNAHFESCQPLTTPEGLPLDAFQMSFWVYIAS